MIIPNLFVFIISLAILIKSSDFFVEYASKIAKHFNISDFVIGITLVAIGTSLPELGAVIAASLSKSSGLVIGTIIGSNIANLGLIMGVVATFTVLNIKKEIWYKDGLLLLLFSFIFAFFAIDGQISFIEGLFCLFIFIIYISRLFKIKEKIIKKRVELRNNKKNRKKIIIHFLIILISAGAIALSAKQVITSASNLAILFNIPETIVAVMMIAIGTSLPELMVSLSAIKKKLGDLLIGNIIGSNISNLFLVGGISAIISPILVSSLTLFLIIPAMLVLTIIFLSLIRAHWVLKMFHGLILLISYIVFIVILFFFM